MACLVGSLVALWGALGGEVGFGEAKIRGPGQQPRAKVWRHGDTYTACSGRKISVVARCMLLVVRSICERRVY